MVRVLERLKKYCALLENDPEDESLYKRISSKLPLFEKMYAKLLKKRMELNFKSSFFSKSPSKGLGNESTWMDSKDFISDEKSYSENLSVSNSIQSLVHSFKTCNFIIERVHENYDINNEEEFDKKLNEIREIILMLKKTIELI